MEQVFQTIQHLTFQKKKPFISQIIFLQQLTALECASLFVMDLTAHTLLITLG
jgi:hypothetical protein